MNDDLWSLGKPASTFHRDWLVVPVKDAVKHETEAVAIARKEEQHFIACAKSDAKHWKEKHAEEIKHRNYLLDKMEEKHKQEMEELQNELRAIKHDWYPPTEARAKAYREELDKARLCEKKEGVSD
ncbi:MAG TPA: hypothetical protein VMX17_06020 [Candidatus Glassbacteria bacterium]|nr:hypothetical protein [Candidatus Glassbacteria bacterium]